MLVGYARVSTVDQDPACQLRALEERGCENVFTDRCSGKQAARPQLPRRWTSCTPPIPSWSESSTASRPTCGT